MHFEQPHREFNHFDGSTLVARAKFAPGLAHFLPDMGILQQENCLRDSVSGTFRPPRRPRIDGQLRRLLEIAGVGPYDYRDALRASLNEVLPTEIEQASPNQRP